MRNLLVVVVLLLVAAAVLFGPGLFHGGETVDPGGRTPSTAPGTGPTLDRPEASAPAAVPEEEPAPEVLRVERPLKVLVLMGHATQRWPRMIEMALQSDAQLQVSGWAASSHAGAPPFGNLEPPPGGLPPSASWFEAMGFEVLALCDIDPGVFEPAFWDGVAARVKAGTLGLWAQPAMPPPQSSGGVASGVHPMLASPVLRALLPVARAAEVRGTPVPGVHASGAVFQATAAGERHPASRIVYWPEWSRRVWQMGAAASPPWGTRFCYPVEALVPGSVVLVEALPPAGSPVPMYVQGPESAGRVLWFGAQQLADDTLRDGRQAQKWYALIHNAVVWLAGRAP
ncbi:MAG: hypothetical protein ACKOCB_04045 [Planctomycetia bacterium]